MPDNNAVPETRHDDTELAPVTTSSRPGAVVPIIVVAAAIVLGVLTVVFAWGWVVWMLALGLCAFGLLFLSAASGKSNRTLIVGGIAAVAVVLGGVGAVRLQPFLPAGFAIDDREELVGRSGDTIVVAGTPEEGQFGVRGLSLSGDELWSSAASAGDEKYRDADSDTPDPEVSVVDDLVVVLADDDTPNSTGRVAIGLDAATGDELWSREVPAASEYLTATLETLVLSAPDEGTTALYLATGIPRWTNPSSELSTSRVKDTRRIDERVITENGAAWALLEGSSEAFGAAAQAQAIDLDSGEPGGALDVGSADYLMVGGVLVTQEYGETAESARTLVGTSVDGRVGWSRLVPDFDGSTSTMDAVGGDVRVLLPAGAAVLSATSGELASHELPSGSEYSHRALAIQSRYELVFGADDSAAAFDTMTGEQVALPTRGTLSSSLSTVGDAEQTVLGARIDDAVGGRAFRYDVVTEKGVQTIYADSDDSTWRPGALQIDDRVVPLR